MSDDLISAHGDVDVLMPYLHLPVQSGSDRVLGDMNRRHTSADYLQLVDQIRTARPDIALSSDFIVGFPARPTLISNRHSIWFAKSNTRVPIRSGTARVLAHRQLVSKTKSRMT